MSRLWSDHVAGLKPYVPGEQVKLDNLLKLNTNEHPNGPSPRALEAIRHAANDDLRLYPPVNSLELREAIASWLKVDAEQVFLGNGSDEILAHVFSALFLRAGRPLLMPDITYSFYTTYSTYYGVPTEIIPLASDFSIQVADYTTQRDVPAAGIIFANPNAPTGRNLSLAEIEAILQANPDTVVVVDEAYVDFGGQSAVTLVNQYDNLLVIQTFSKSRALAGLRVGFAVAQKGLLEALARVKDSFNSYPMDTLALAGAVASVQDHEYFEQQCQVVIDAREQLVKELSSLGFNVLPSKTNFLMVSHTTHTAIELQQALRAQGILVRHFKQARIENYLRITVGSPAQCQRLCDALKVILNRA